MAFFKVSSVNKLELDIFYESTDDVPFEDHVRFIDHYDTIEAWERQVAIILRLAEEQGTKEPIVEIDLEGVHV